MANTFDELILWVFFCWFAMGEPKQRHFWTCFSLRDAERQRVIPRALTSQHPSTVVTSYFRVEPTRATLSLWKNYLNNALVYGMKCGLKKYFGLKKKRKKKTSFSFALFPVQFGLLLHPNHPSFFFICTASVFAYTEIHTHTHSFFCFFSSTVILGLGLFFFHLLHEFRCAFFKCV